MKNLPSPLFVTRYLMYLAMMMDVPDVAATNEDALFGTKNDRFSESK